MTRRFPRRAFVPLGALPAERLGLSARRSAELRLHGAWARAAGPRLAALATPRAIRRGVLELRMTTADEAWCRTLSHMAPALAASVAAAQPGLGVDSVALFSLEGHPVGEVQALAPEPLPAPAETPKARPPAAKGDRRLRLDRLMRAYLSRSEPPSSGD